MASSDPSSSTVGSPARKRGVGAVAAHRPGTSGDPILIDSSGSRYLDTSQSDIRSVASSHASRRSIASEATKHRVAADIRNERARQLQLTATAAADAANAAIALFVEEGLIAERLRVTEEEALNDCEGSQDSLPSLTETDYARVANPHSFNEVDEEAGGRSSPSI